MTGLEKHIAELLEILSCGDAQPEEIKNMLPSLQLALKDPKQYLKENPDDQWLSEGFNLDELNITLNENIFAWRLSAELVDFAAIGDKADELYDQVVEVLDDMEITIPAPNEKLKSWAEYAKFLEQQLLQNKTGKKVVALDINFSDDLSVFVIEREKSDRLKILLDYFNLPQVES